MRKSYASLPACPTGTSSLGNTHDFITGERNLYFQRKRCEKEWTILVFLAMDNNLNDFGEDDLSELAWGKAEFDPNHAYDLVVEADFRNKSSKRYVFESNKSNNNPENIRVADTVVENFFGEEQNTGDPRTLENYLSWVMEELPSKHYLFVMSGHGDGWAASVEDDRGVGKKSRGGRAGNGIAYDESHQDWLTIPDIRRVLTRVENKYLQGQAIDIYAADACYMQQAEVVYELRKQAHFIYGSLPIMAYQGLPFKEILRKLSRGDYKTPRDLAVSLPELMVSHYQEKNNRMLASVVDTAVLEKDFIQDLVELGKAGMEWLKTSDELLVDQFLVLQLAKKIIFYQNAVVEFRDFLMAWRNAIYQRGAGTNQNFRTEEEKLLSAIGKMLDTLDKVVISAAMGDAFDSRKDRIAGLSIWFPSTELALTTFERNVYFSSMHRRGCDCSDDPTNTNAWNLFLLSLYTL